MSTKQRSGINFKQLICVGISHKENWDQAAWGMGN